MRRVLKYSGSKWNIASQLVKLMPPHHSYIEPYFGSGAVLFNKTALLHRDNQRPGRRGDKPFQVHPRRFRVSGQAGDDDPVQQGGI